MSNIRTGLLACTQEAEWDAYVLHHPDGSLCHLAAWKKVIEKAYEHKGYYLLATEGETLVGLLPLFHIKSRLFGSSLVSMPYLNYGGILAETTEAESRLLEEALRLCSELNVSTLELRQTRPFNYEPPVSEYRFIDRVEKVRMLLELPDSPDALFRSFKSKLRSQIRRPQKEGMEAETGGVELLNDFYRVFSLNMRDLGSPVHSKRLFGEIFAHLQPYVRIGVVRHMGSPVGAGLIFCFRNTVEIPWASTLRDYNRLSPNMLLYWSLLEYACVKGFRFFDFGRSTPEEGTYRFKKQWGAQPYPMHWFSGYRTGTKAPISPAQSRGMKTVSSLWKRLPLFLANLLGPKIRRSISL